MLVNHVRERLWDIFQDYREATTPVTVGAATLIAAIFLVEILVTFALRIESIRVFSTGLFGVLPVVAWVFSAVLHRGIPHFIANIALLVVLGVPLEQHFKTRHYAAFLLLTGYLSVGIGAGILVLFSDQQVAFYGASGSIFALAGFGLVHLLRHHTDRSVIDWFIILIGVSALFAIGIDASSGPFFEPEWVNGGHVSGFVLGCIASLLMGSNCSVSDE